MTAGRSSMLVVPESFTTSRPCQTAALQVPVAGKNRFSQLERFRIKAPRFFERLVDARHYRLGPTSRSGPRVGRVERGVVLICGPLA